MKRKKANDPMPLYNKHKLRSRIEKGIKSSSEDLIKLTTKN